MRYYTQSFIYIKTYRIVSKTNLNMSYNKKILKGILLTLS